MREERLAPPLLSRPNSKGRHVTTAVCPWVGPISLSSIKNAQGIWYTSPFEKQDPNLTYFTCFT